LDLDTKKEMDVTECWIVFAFRLHWGWSWSSGPSTIQFPLSFEIYCCRCPDGDPVPMCGAYVLVFCMQYSIEIFANYWRISPPSWQRRWCRGPRQWTICGTESGI